MTTGIPGDHLARFQGSLKRTNDRLYELERRLGVKQTALRRKPVQPPGAHMFSGDISVADNTNVVVSTMTVSWDSGGVGSASRITVPAGFAGIWSITFHLRWDYQFPSATEEFNFHLQRYNSAGTFVTQWGSGDTSHTDGKGMSLQVRMNAGDYMQINLYQISGATRLAQVIHFGGFLVRPF